MSLTIQTFSAPEPLPAGRVQAEQAGQPKPWARDEYLPAWWRNEGKALHAMLSRYVQEHPRAMHIGTLVRDFLARHLHELRGHDWCVATVAGHCAEWAHLHGIETGRLDARLEGRE